MLFKTDTNVCFVEHGQSFLFADNQKQVKKTKSAFFPNKATETSLSLNELKPKELFKTKSCYVVSKVFPA